MNEPAVLVHVALALQFAVPLVHSLMSVQVTPLPVKPELHAQVLVPGPVLVQVALTLQPPLLTRQLSISLQVLPSSDPAYPALHANCSNRVALGGLAAPVTTVAVNWTLVPNVTGQETGTMKLQVPLAAIVTWAELAPVAIVSVSPGLPRPVRVGVMVSSVAPFAGVRNSTQGPVEMGSPTEPGRLKGLLPLAHA